MEPADSAEGRYCDRLPSSLNQTLLIVVCSAVENVDRRNAIRSVTLTYFLGRISEMRELRFHRRPLNFSVGPSYEGRAH